jgi:hypothetical protein
LALVSFAPTSFDTTLAFTTLHPRSNSYFLFFLKNYELDQDLKFSSNSFKLTFQHMLHLLVSGPFGMAFEHVWDYFHLEDLVMDFLVISTLLSYRSRSHSTLNCMCPWSSSPFTHDQTFKWNLSHYNGGNII